jgi:hypothetical protein
MADHISTSIITELASMALPTWFRLLKKYTGCSQNLSF